MMHSAICRSTAGRETFCLGSHHHVDRQHRVQCVHLVYQKDLHFNPSQGVTSYFHLYQLISLIRAVEPESKQFWMIGARAKNFQVVESKPGLRNLGSGSTALVCGTSCANNIMVFSF